MEKSGVKNDISFLNLELTDKNDKLMKNLCEDFKLNENDLKLYLSCNLDLIDKDIINLWEATIKWNINDKDKIKLYIVKYIYEKNNYKLEILNKTAAVSTLLQGTCINTSGTKCADMGTCYEAVYNNHIYCLRYLHKEKRRDLSAGDFNCSADQDLDIIKYLHENKCPFNDPIRFAAESGKLDNIKYLHKNGYPLTDDACKYAAGNNHLDCLIYLHENGCPWSETACNYSAYCDSLECLKYLHENGCPWSTKTCIEAAENGSLDCLKYLHEKGCPWTKDAYDKAALYGKLNCLKYLNENGCPRSKNACNNAVENACNNATEREHFDCLEYLHKNEFEWSNDIYSHSMFSLKCLTYIYEHMSGHCKNCTNSTCKKISQKNKKYVLTKIKMNYNSHGTLDCLKFLHEKGLKLTERMYKIARKNDAADCFDYYKKHLVD